MAFIISHVFTFIEIFISPQGFMLLSGVLISPYRIFMSVCSKTGLVVANSLSFCLYGNVLLLPHFWRTVILDVDFWLTDIFLWVLWIYLSTVFWPPKFLMRNLVIVFLRIPSMCNSFLSSYFQHSLFNFWKLDYVCL